MSKLLANLYLFCENQKESSQTLVITQHTHIQEVTEHACESIEFEINAYESFNILIDQGARVLSFMIQGCTLQVDGAVAQVYHSNQLYLQFEFVGK
ncbi:hypothetical protein D3C73_1137780 [compost metagenome]